MSDRLRAPTDLGLELHVVDLENSLEGDRSARLDAQRDLAECREAMTRAEHDAQRARGELAVAVAAEREACAKVCDAMKDRWFRMNVDKYTDAALGANACAAAIRARGQS